MNLTPKRTLSILVVAAAVASTGLWATRAWAAGCAQTLPTPLVTLCPNAPAVASDVNANFAAVLAEVSRKVGAYGTSTVTVTSDANIAGNLTVSGAATLPIYTTATCAHSPCYCNKAGDVALSWQGSCNGAGVAVYAAYEVVGPGNLAGFDVTCITSNFAAEPPMLSMKVKCLKGP